MENLNQITNDIIRIFEIVCVISDEKELFFEDSSVLHHKLVSANNIISNIKLQPIIDEVWEYSSFPDREYQIISLVNDRFDKLITWKPQTVSILEMNDKLTVDLTSFYNRQACIDRNYSQFEQSVINSLYKEIGQRAYKLDSELTNIMNNFFDRIRYEQLELGTISEQFTFKLNPKKASHFAHLLTEMYKQSFFIPTNKENGLSDFEVLLAFGDLFKYDLFEHYMECNVSDFIPIDGFENSKDSEHLLIPESEKTEFTGKPFPEYLLHPDNIKLGFEIRNEFSTEKGKAIRLLLHVLETSNPPIITIGYRQRKELHAAMTEFFGRNIGKYQSVFDYKIDEKLDKKDMENIKTRLNHILSLRLDF